MVFSDTAYLPIFAVIFIITVLSVTLIYNTIFPVLAPVAPTNITTSLNVSFNNVIDFLDQSFGAIFFLLSVVVLLLAIFLPSHPAFLLLWFLMNIVMFFVYDITVDILTTVNDTPINTGEMDNAQSFFNSIMPKALFLLNGLAAIILFGKRVYGNG